MVGLDPSIVLPWTHYIMTEFEGFWKIENGGRKSSDAVTRRRGDAEKDLTPCLPLSRLP
jgi:hypothetical protein